MQAPALHLGIATWNIHGLGETLTENVKRKLEWIVKLFGRNPWLELLCLQEVGSQNTIQSLDTSEHCRILTVGPEIRSISTKGTLKTCEFYPLVVRHDCRWQLSQISLWWPHEDIAEDWTSGTVVWRDRTEQGLYEVEIIELMKAIGGDQAERRPKEKRPNYFTRLEELLYVLAFRGTDTRAYERLKWLFAQRRDARNAEDARCRPIIVYDLQCDGQLVHVAVVHTTPDGGEFARKTVYAQIDKLLREIANQSNWVVIGDFYLTAEADLTTDRDYLGSTRSQKRWRPREQSSTFAKQLQQLGLHMVAPISATNWPVSAQRSGKEDAMQVADYLIASGNWQCRVVGLFNPFGEQGGLLEWDTNHDGLKTWIRNTTSDHVPVGALLGLVEMPEALRLFVSGCQSTSSPFDPFAISNPDEFVVTCTCTCQLHVHAGNYKTQHSVGGGDCFYDCMRQFVAQDQSITDLRQITGQLFGDAGDQQIIQLIRHFGIRLVVHAFHWADLSHETQHSVLVGNPSGLEYHVAMLMGGGGSHFQPLIKL
jgi:hypothetical protein